MSPKCVAEVFLLAENRLLREALVRLLAKKNVRVVGASPCSAAVIDEIAHKKPGVVLLDSSGLLSNSTAIASLRSSVPGVKVVMVDMDPDANSFLKAVREGVVGYVLKDASAMEVAATIRAVAVGEAVCPPSLSMALFRCVSLQLNPVTTFPARPDLGLSRREEQLVELLAERLTNKEIAAQLNLSEQTVKNHVHNILRKLGVNDRVSIVKVCESDRVHDGAVTAA
jgi:DNA-binding NarL/FixJ family response regulator